MSVGVFSDMILGDEVSYVLRNNFIDVFRVLNKGLNSNLLVRTNLCVTYSQGTDYTTAPSCTS